MRVSEHDLERLELYLDRELTDAQTQALDARMASEPTLSAELERLRGDRTIRLEAMSTAFDTDAATIERLVMSVRTAQASEALEMRRRTLLPSWLPMRSAMSAAACVALGLLLGVALERQHGGGIIAMPAGPSVSPNVPLNNISLNSNALHVVSVKDAATGRELMKYRFFTREDAQRFIDHVNRGGDIVAPLDVGDARIINESY